MVALGQCDQRVSSSVKRFFCSLLKQAFLTHFGFQCLPNLYHIRDLSFLPHLMRAPTPCRHIQIAPGPNSVPAVGPSGLNVGGVGAMVRSSIVEPSWDATSHGSFVDSLAGCIIVDPLGLRYLLKSVVLHRSIGGEGILPTAFAYSLLQWTLIAISKGIRLRIDTSTAIMDHPIPALGDVTSVVFLQQVPLSDAKMRWESLICSDATTAWCWRHGYRSFYLLPRTFGVGW